MRSTKRRLTLSCHLLQSYQTISSLSIPQSLKYCGVKPQKNMLRSRISFQAGSSSKKDNECVIVAQSINPNDTTSIQQIKEDNRNVSVKQSNVKGLQKFSNDLKNTNDRAFQKTRQHDTIEMETKVSDGRTETMSLGNQNVRFYCLKNKVLVVMDVNSKFSFTGKLTLKVLYGEVEVYGYSISSSTPALEIYSPRGYNDVYIQTSNKMSPYNILDTWTMLAAEGVTRDVKSMLQTDIDGCKPGMAVAILRNIENKLTEFLSNFYPHKLFPDIKNVSRYSWTDPRRAEITLQSNIYLDFDSSKTISVHPLMPIIREKILNGLHSERTCTLIAGGNGTGKSTLTRYVINSLLPDVKGVILLDIDIGQSECTPPGCISYSLIEEPLLGPSFTHLKTPVYQLYLGNVDVMRCLRQYLNGVRILMDKLSNSSMSHLPIIVNTMGFTYGIGWDIIVFLIKLIRPTLIVQLTSENPKKNFVYPLSKEIINKQNKRFLWNTSINNWHWPCYHALIVMDSKVKHKTEIQNWTLKAAEKRELALISYLIGIVQFERRLTSNTTLSLNVNAAVPYTVPFSSLHVASLGTDVPPSHVLTVMNGNIVALCGVDLKDSESSNSGLRVLNYFPLDACYGFGIVRGVDMEKEEIFINTPLPHSIMKHVNCLVGCIPVPLMMLQLNKPGVPYAGGNDVLPTSREPRRGYFRMRHQKKDK